MTGLISTYKQHARRICGMWALPDSALEAMERGTDWEYNQLAEEIVGSAIVYTQQEIGCWLWAFVGVFPIVHNGILMWGEYYRWQCGEIDLITTYPISSYPHESHVMGEIAIRIDESITEYVAWVAETGKDPAGFFSKMSQVQVETRWGIIVG